MGQGYIMSSSSGMGQLLKGVVIGIVLLLAIVGTMSILDTGKNNETAQNTNIPVIEPANIPAPSISVASSSPNAETQTEATAEATTETKPDEFKPTLEGEKTEEEKTAEIEKQAEPVVNYGMLKVGAVNPSNQERLKADYIIFNDENKKVAESKSTEGTSFRLPVGQYKVVTTLSKPTDSARTTEPVQTTEFVSIRADSTSNQTFELEPPPTIGVLQVSATDAKSGQAMKASFIVQKEDGETVATRQNVTNSLFKLKAGSYKVTVNSGKNSDFRTIVVEPGESTQEVFKLQEAFSLGKVLVRIFEVNSNKPVRADIMIATTDGTTVQELKSVFQTEISLPAGNYSIRVTGPDGQSNKIITVTAGQAISEIFRFDTPTGDETPNEVQITDNVKITGTEQADEVPPEQTTPSEDPEAEQSQEEEQLTQGSLKLFAQNDDDQQAIKSNFYVQTPNGKHIAKKIYANSAEFNLEPGVYKITVRSKNRSNIVRTVQVHAGENISESFSLRKNIKEINNQEDTTSPVSTPPVPVLAPPKPVKNTAIPNGFLAVNMRPARKTHFVVTSKSGKKIVELTSVPSANFKLDTGNYVVTAIHNKVRRRKNVSVREGQTSRVSFNAEDFQANSPQTTAITKGILRSRILDRSGRPLRGNLTVTNMQGQVVARANGVTVGVFDLPPSSHTVIVDYQGLRGSERVNIKARETTVQTFTIAPNSAPPPVNNQAPQKTENQNIKDILRNKLEEEIRKQF